MAPTGLVSCLNIKISHLKHASVYGYASAFSVCHLERCQKGFLLYLEEIVQIHPTGSLQGNINFDSVFCQAGHSYPGKWHIPADSVLAASPKAEMTIHTTWVQGHSFFPTCSHMASCSRTLLAMTGVPKMWVY